MWDVIARCLIAVAMLRGDGPVAVLLVRCRMKIVLAVAGYLVLVVIAALAGNAGRAVAIETGEVHGTMQSVYAVVSLYCLTGGGGILVLALSSGRR